MFQIVIPSTRKGPAWLACKKGVLGLVPLLGPWWALWAGGMGHPGSLSLVLDVKKTAGFRVPSLGGCPGRILHPWVGGWDGAAGCWGRARVGVLPLALPMAAIGWPYLREFWVFFRTVRSRARSIGSPKRLHNKIGEKVAGEVPPGAAPWDSANGWGRGFLARISTNTGPTNAIQGA